MATTYIISSFNTFCKNSTFMYIVCACVCVCVCMRILKVIIAYVITIAVIYYLVSFIRI